MTEQTSPEPDAAGLRFLSREQYRAMFGQHELDRQLHRLRAHHRDGPGEEPSPPHAAGDFGGPP